MSKRNKKRSKFVESLERRRLLASIVITKGGTYSGTWESLDRSVPAVKVATNQPVIIENSTIRGMGDLIVSGTSNTNITVRNVKGYGLNPNVYGKLNGEAISVDNFDNLVVENSYFEHTTGINMLNYAGDRTPSETVRIVGNTIKDVDGRKSDGNGGYLTFNTRTRKSDGVTEDGFDYAQFIQFDKVIGVPGIEVAWNQVVNLPGESRAEDVISVYKSSGTSSSPIRIHDNYIQGAYTVKPWQADTSDATYTYDWGFSGGGIMLGDGVGSTAAQDPAFVKAYNNTIISTTNYGIALSAGHDLEAYNNRVFSSGLLADGRKIQNQNVGIYVWDSYKAGPSKFYNVTAHDNLVGWVQLPGRNDWWSPTASTLKNNTAWSGQVTLATELAEYNRWKAAWEAQGGVVTPPPVVDPPPVDPPPVDPPPVDPPPVDPPVEPPVVDPPPVDPPVEPPVVDPPPVDPPVHQPPVEPPVVDPPPVDPPVEPPIVDPPPVDPPVEPPVVDPPVLPIDFSGVVFNDLDGDGARDANEDGIAGRRVYADENGDGKLNAKEKSTLTNSNGEYTLTAAPDAKIRLVVPSGWYVSSAGEARDASDEEEVNFGAVEYAKVSGSVFRDTDRDGAKDVNEAGIAGVKVYIDRDNDNVLDAGEVVMTTGASGMWSFANLRPGNYTVRTITPEHNQVRTTPAQQTHAVISGSEFEDEFGYAGPASQPPVEPPVKPPVTNPPPTHNPPKVHGTTRTPKTHSTKSIWH